MGTQFRVVSEGPTHALPRERADAELHAWGPSAYIAHDARVTFPIAHTLFGWFDVAAPPANATVGWSSVTGPQGEDACPCGFTSRTPEALRGQGGYTYTSTRATASNADTPLSVWADVEFP